MEESNEEGLINGSIDSISIKKMDKLINQIKKCICKVDGNKIGTGFFSKIKYNNELISVMITNYHIIDDNYIKNNKQIKISINENLQLININEKIYSSITEEYDIMIIKIKEEEIKNYLEIDENIYNNNSEELYKNQSIYILHYPNGGKVSISFGYGIEKINNYDIKHLCNTEVGSSGGPILCYLTNKVIGIHKGFLKKGFNLGTFLKFPLNELNNDNDSEVDLAKIYNVQILETKYLDNYDYMLDIILVGDTNTGKTKILEGFLQKGLGDYPSIGLDINIKYIQIKKKYISYACLIFVVGKNFSS